MWGLTHHSRNSLRDLWVTQATAAKPIFNAALSAFVDLLSTLNKSITSFARHLTASFVAMEESNSDLTDNSAHSYCRDDPIDVEVFLSIESPATQPGDQPRISSGLPYGHPAIGPSTASSKIPSIASCNWARCLASLMLAIPTASAFAGYAPGSA